MLGTEDVGKRFSWSLLIESPICPAPPRLRLFWTLFSSFLHDSYFRKRGREGGSEEEEEEEEEA